MKSDFLLAITQLAAEKNLPKDVVLGAVEAALVSAYRKDNFAPDQELTVKIDPVNGRVKVWAEKKVVEKSLDKRTEVMLEEAREVNVEAQFGDLVMIEDTPDNAGRIAAQTAKQVILQRLHEAENSAIFEQFADKEGDIVNSVVQRVETRQVIVDLGRAEAVMPNAEQMFTERYRAGQRLKLLLLEVARTPKGPLLIVSRSHPSLLRRLFEIEVPEVYSGIVEIKSVAREAGIRSKVAVAARQAGIDPVGCCVGLRGIRIQNIVSELNGEKIDVVAWDENPATFIASALSPAQVVKVKLDDVEKSATVVIPDRQLSLAIGKEGQNVRLAVKLTQWRIDIKSVSETEAEKVGAEEELSKTAVADEAEASPVDVSAFVEPVLLPEEETGEPIVEEPVVEEQEEGEVVPLTVLEEPVVVKATPDNVSGLRFAEDMTASELPRPSGDRGKKSKNKKGPTAKKGAPGGMKPKKKGSMAKKGAPGSTKSKKRTQFTREVVPDRNERDEE
jgi:N utilization substance protein A